MKNRSPETLPPVLFPSIPKVPMKFAEAISFTSPEVSARMDRTIRGSKLNDFKSSVVSSRN